MVIGFEGENDLRRLNVGRPFPLISDGEAERRNDRQQRGRAEAQRYADGANIVRIVSVLRRLRVVTAYGLCMRCDGLSWSGKPEVFSVNVTKG